MKGGLPSNEEASEKEVEREGLKKVSRVHRVFKTTVVEVQRNSIMQKTKSQKVDG